MQRLCKYLLWAFGGGLLLIAGWLLLRIAVCDQFVVPSDSMTPTLVAGDRILVNKLIVGARIYKRFDFGRGIPLSCFRLPGLRRAGVNDIVVFNAPRGYDRGRIGFKINYVYSKRCIGTPGDSISVRNGFFYNNRHRGPIGDTAQQQRLSATPDSMIPVRVLRAMPFDDKLFGWTIRNFGPLYVPRAGDSIVLDLRCYKLYRQVIEYETGGSLSFRAGQVYLGDEPLRGYSFRKDYYFFCGDNVSDSKDSRYLGFVPEEFIIGVVRRIRYSEDPYTSRRRSDRRWKRVY